MSSHEIEAAAMALPAHERARLAQALLASLDEGDDSPAEVERVWIEEAERRFEELRSGEVQGVPADEVFDRIRARLR